MPARKQADETEEAAAVADAEEVTEPVEPPPAPRSWRVLGRISYTHDGGDATAGPGEVVADLPDDQAADLAAAGLVEEI